MTKLENVSLTQISMSRDGTAWGLNRSGQLLKTSGFTLRPVTSYDNKVIDYISAIDSMSAIGLINEQIFFTDDAGATWREKAVTHSYSFARISVGASNSAWAISNAGKLLLTTDLHSGNWEQFPHYFNFVEVSALNYNDAWAIGTEGQVVFIQDRQLSQTTGWLTKISAQSASNVVGVNTSGDILSSDNGGQTWRPISGKLKDIAIHKEVSFAYGINDSDEVFILDNFY